MSPYIEEYFATIKEWEQRYGVPARAYKYDPTEIKASCARCGKVKKKMSRHHKGNDFFFARLRPDWYAARYIRFEKEDIAKLCDNCHKNIHKYYKPLVKRMMKELLEGGNAIVTKEWCDNWLTEFRNAFEKWTHTPYRRKRK